MRARRSSRAAAAAGADAVSVFCTSFARRPASVWVARRSTKTPSACSRNTIPMSSSTGRVFSRPRHRRGHRRRRSPAEAMRAVSPDEAMRVVTRAEAESARKVDGTHGGKSRDLPRATRNRHTERRLGSRPRNSWNQEVGSTRKTPSRVGSQASTLWNAGTQLSMTPNPSRWDSRNHRNHRSHWNLPNRRSPRNLDTRGSARRA